MTEFNVFKGKTVANVQLSDNQMSVIVSFTDSTSALIYLSKPIGLDIAGVLSVCQLAPIEV